ncbi:MAG: helicase [Naasia sp.]|nr:helicase [Naasia sp.]
MKLSRKRKKELRRLRSSAEELWQQQQEVIDHASAVVRQASKQANLLTQEHVVPRVKTTYEARLKPGVDKASLVGRAVATGVSAKVAKDVLPGVNGAIASVLGVLAAAKAGSGLFAAPQPPKKSGPGAGTIVAIVLGVLALAGVAYAAWQTFRADDDLWIADDEPEVTGTADSSDVPKAPTA